MYLQAVASAETPAEQAFKLQVVLVPFWGVNWKEMMVFCSKPYIIISEVKFSFDSLVQNCVALLLKLLRSAP
jgi:hypothetical protein